MKFDLLVVYYVGFVAYFDYTVYSVSLLAYIDSLVGEEKASFIYSLTLSAQAAAQVISSFSVGYLARIFPMKYVFIAVESLGILGCIIYGLAAYPINSAWAILIARILAGLGYGAYALGLAYMGIVIEDPIKRASVIANFRAVGIFGAIPSSFVAMLLAIPYIDFSIGNYSFNQYTYPAWVTCAVEISALLGIIFGIKHTPLTGPPDKTVEDPRFAGKKIYISIGVSLSILIFFYDGYIISSISYIMPVVMLDGYMWSVLKYSPVVVLLSIVGTLAAFSSKYVSKLLKGKQYIVIVPAIGYICVMCVLAVVGLPGVGLPNWLGSLSFLFAVETQFAAFEVLQTMMSTLFAQLVPRDFIVRMMPITAGVYSIGKIVGPLICELEVAIFGPSLIFYVMLVTSGLLMFVTWFFSKHLNWRNNSDLSDPVTINDIDNSVISYHTADSFGP